MQEVTVLIPFKRGGPRAWLEQAIGSLPLGTPYMVLENDGELAEALNAGLEAAKTEYVFRLDADDRVQRDTLEFLHSLIWDVDVTYPSFVFMREGGSLTKEGIKAPSFCPNRLLVKNFVPGTSMFRRQAALDVGGYRDFPLLEDWDLWVRMSRAGKKFKAVPEAVYFYRQHGGQRNKVPAEERDAITEKLREQIVGERPEFLASFHYQASFATSYVRCLQPAKYLPGYAIQTPEFVSLEDSLHFFDQPPVSVWQFPGDSARAIMMAEMQEQGMKVFVEVDDNYLSTAMLGVSWAKKHKDGEHTLEAHRKIAGWADGILVTTEELAKKYRKVNENVHVCPNQVDPSDWPEPAERDEVLRVGWFGSHSHYADINLVHRALEWASRQPNVEVVTMGVDPKWKFKRKHYPWTNDHGVVRKLIGSVDIGLAPVVPDPWSVCRSDLKILEYAMGGAVTIHSEVPPYVGWEDKPTLKARNAKDFYHHVKWCVNNRDEVAQLAREVRQHVLTHRTIQGNVDDWRHAFQAVCAV